MAEMLNFLPEGVRVVMYFDELIHPIVFRDSEEEARFYSPSDSAEINLATTPPLEMPLLKGMIRCPGKEIDSLPTEAEILDSPVRQYPFAAVQMTGDIYNIYQQDQTALDKQPPASAVPRQPVAPKGLDLTDKLIRKRYFTKCEGQLYVYKEEKGIHIPIKP